MGLKNFIVIDTSVLTDIFLESRPRHLQARKLALYLVTNNIRIKFPFHALFELSCAMKDERRSPSFQEYEGITENNPLLVDPIPVDENFFSTYFNPKLPYLKAGDLLFVALARGENAILITEDKNQFKAAIDIGIEAYKLEEFLESFVKTE